MRILHLSDMHFTKDKQREFELNILNPMIKDLKKFNDDKQFDLIIYSGDLVDKGGKSFNNDLTLAFLEFDEKIIQPLLSALNLKNEDFIMVPGNHDIKRDEDSQYIENGLKSSLNNYDEVYKFMESHRTEHNWEGINRIKAYKDFEKHFYDGNINISKFESIHFKQINEFKVGILALNSSWRCYDSDTDKGNIILGESQIDNGLIKFKKEGASIKIAVIHHPIEELHPFEKKEIQNKLYREFDIIFSGHVHYLESYQIDEIHGKTLLVKAPSNWISNIKSPDIDFLNGYSIIDYKFGEKIDIYYRRYSKVKNKFIADNDKGDINGKVTYSFPTNFNARFIL